jgi:hypothetical protein
LNSRSVRRFGGQRAGFFLNSSDWDALGNAGRPCLVGAFGSQTSGSADWFGLIHQLGSGRSRSLQK